MSDLDARRAFRLPAHQVGPLLFQAVIEDARRLRFGGSSRQPTWWLIISYFIACSSPTKALEDAWDP